MGSSFPRKEPHAESIERYGGRVIRIPIAAKPLMVSLLPREGEGPAEDPRAGPKLALLLHIKAPSFQGPAVAAKQTEVS